TARRAVAASASFRGQRDSPRGNRDESGNRTNDDPCAEGGHNHGRPGGDVLQERARAAGGRGLLLLIRLVDLLVERVVLVVGVVLVVEDGRAVPLVGLEVGTLVVVAVDVGVVPRVRAHALASFRSSVWSGHGQSSVCLSALVIFFRLNPRAF